MAIKIPRGEIPIPSVGNRGNSMLNAVQSNKINYNKLLRCTSLTLLVVR